MGSSMGGLISLYAFLREPEAFGFAGVMSPSLWFANGAIFDYVASRGNWTGKIYVDVGTREGRPAVRNARLMARLLRRTASRPRLGVMYVEGRGAVHNESAWADRFERAVRFLLPRRPADLHW
jgi:predicted alpha/beta superfamily hydrolase